MRCDVSREEDVKSLFSWIQRKFGRVDVLINNAAHFKSVSVVDTTVQEAQCTWMTNVMGPLWCMREAIKMPRLQQDGCPHVSSLLIVNVLATCIDGGRARQGIYAASKAALNSLSDCLIHDLAHQHEENIVLLKIVPRRTLTDMRRLNFPQEDPKACMDPQDVADAIVTRVDAFARDEKSIATGTVVRIKER